MSSYLTLGRDAEAEIEVKRSRFLATLVRVEDEPAARAVVERLRARHWDARHHCTAFRLGPPPLPVERSSDDGEPAGTAGAPMLEVLRGAGVSDTVVVVSRWFGGTLLGAGPCSASTCWRSTTPTPAGSRPSSGCAASRSSPRRTTSARRCASAYRPRARSGCGRWSPS